MSYAGKTLLLVLLSKLAPLSSATVSRKGWGTSSTAGKAASVSRVMKEVAELLQIHRDDPVVEHQVNMPSEDAIENMSSHLKDAISEIEDQVQPLIIASRDATQDEINKRVEDLTNANIDLVKEKETADTADDKWIKCVENEKGMAKNIEDAKAALEQSTNARNAACQLQEDNRYFNDKIDPEHMKFQCDISLSSEHNCDAQWLEFLTDFETVYEAFLDEVDVAVEVHDGHANACAQAENDVKAKESHLSTAIKRYEEQHQKCMDDFESRKQSMCKFETKYTSKCDSKNSYADLMREIDSVDGGDYSHPDRVHEWTTTAMTICLLQKIMETSMVDTTHVDECEAEVNTDHLKLAMQQQRFTELTTEPNYDCAEPSITFMGDTWVTPASAPVPPAPSASYKLEPFHPELPFSFCAAGTVH